MSATQATRHPTGVILTPDRWTVHVDGRQVGDISAYSRSYAPHHYPAGQNTSHLTETCADNWPYTLDEAIAAILACDRNPERCADAQAAQRRRGHGRRGAA
ncbi:MAG: hypothetical protein KIT69_09475 [Propionibacteriaceae bacterium]|nr:hypothetical protein [Propionibacteriaceae bacterium]